MDITRFAERFEREILRNRLLKLAAIRPFNRVARKLLDPCPDVKGMASYRKLMLMDLVASMLADEGAGECYLEIGTFQGKSLVAALKGNPGVKAFACDNFSEFDESGVNQSALEENLRRYGLAERVRFFNMDFRKLLAGWREQGLPTIGGYFYDGAHDKSSQYDGIKHVEPHLADRALVIVDDWRFAKDSQSYAEAGTMQAVSESSSKWKLLHVLPARFNGDLDQWWNGLGILSFERQTKG
jgi:hypothetical protein